MAQDQELNLELDLTPYDPWVIKKMLSDIDVSQQGKLNLPRQDFENFIIPEMVGDLIQNLGNGVKVKVLVYEEEYIVTLKRKSNGSYMLTQNGPHSSKLMVSKQTI
ncbi:B3 domain-containing protein At1g10455 [Eutrema salsugineum]|uniref:B3 domain-containing protein At1g10455 n=1 Tax=Eutrema salsugineum TaxID=72664 RepID=UPI000CED6780|nr:B3 domain-containing protein At1g10455 [Eutrema salsugineum]